MASVILPFLLSMMLGRTIDLSSYNINGLNVFDDAQYDETPAPSLNTTYNVLQSEMVPYTYFGIPIDIVLRMKSNFLSSSSGALGLDGLLKDNSWKYNSAIVSATTIYRTVDRSLKKDATPLPGWDDKLPTSQSHYAHTLYFGGWSVVLFRFKCGVSSDVQYVRKLLTKHLGVAGKLSDDMLSKWDDAIEAIQNSTEIRGEVALHTHVYSTIPFRGTISNPKDLFKIIKKFQGRAGPVGQPIYMDLKPLSELNNKYPELKENVELVDELEKLDMMFDDVKLAKNSIIPWITDTNTVFSEDDEDRISKLLNSLNECIRAFSKLSSDVSLFKPTDREHLDKAFQKYMGGLEKKVGTYDIALRRLKEEIDAQCEGKFLHKVRGLLHVYDDEVTKRGQVKDLNQCMLLCLDDNTCRSIGFAEHMSELDLETGNYHKLLNQCWLYKRSTSTAPVNTPNEFSGEFGVYDRLCY